MRAGRYAEITATGKGVTVAIPPPRLERIYRNREHIADAALGLDDSRRTRIGLQLAPQPQHLDVDAAIENVFMDAGRLQQMLA